MIAKFKVDSVKTELNQEILVMSPVTSNSEENKSFSLYTPWGKLELGITNPNLIGTFNPGDEYLVEFNKV